MTITRKAAGGNVAANVKRRLGGVWVTPAAVWRRASGAWVKVWPTGPSLTLTVSNVTGNSGSGTNSTIGKPTVTVANGTAPYTYSTTFVSGTTLGITDATAAQPTFYRPGNPGDGTVSAVYQVTVTDSAGATATAQFTVTDARVAPVQSTLRVTASNVSGSTSVGTSDEVFAFPNVSVSGGVPPYRTNIAGGSSEIKYKSGAFYRVGNPGAVKASASFNAFVSDDAGASTSRAFTVTDNRS